jgi:YggT family protein
MELIYLIINRLFTLYELAIIVYILMSYFPSMQTSTIAQWLARIVEPYLTPFRRIIKPVMGVIDFSPIIAIIVLRLAHSGFTQVMLRLMGA